MEENEILEETAIETEPETIEETEPETLQDSAALEAVEELRAAFAGELEALRAEMQALRDSFGLLVDNGAVVREGAAEPADEEGGEGEYEPLDSLDYNF